jgi:tetratricopeptide (TPR) repeat protein
LNSVGHVARVQGEWVLAEAVYRESLDLRRQLVERLGGTPEALRDLSVSLNNVGDVARVQGEWVQAEAVYRESLDLRRQLVERLGGTPEALDDLATALRNIAMLPGGGSAALAEAAAIYRDLSTRFPAVVRYQTQLSSLETELAAAPPS